MTSKAYSPVEQKQVSTLVFEQLREAIFRGQLAPGEKLLSERDLACTMQVSRTSVRSALTQLITLGYLENRQGSGTFVVGRDTLAANNPFAAIICAKHSSIDELLEFRIGLGMHGVSLAAERATDTDIAFLEGVLNRSAGGGMGVQVETEADIAFHMGIACATHNSVYVDLTRRFYDYMFFRLRELHSFLYEIEANLDEIDRQHRAILESIRRHDSRAARADLVAHIEFLRRALREKRIY